MDDVQSSFCLNRVIEDGGRLPANMELSMVGCCVWGTLVYTSRCTTGMARR